ncbi:hypothetical protein JAAN108728_11675 [Janibacter anophelis]
MHVAVHAELPQVPLLALGSLPARADDGDSVGAQVGQGVPVQPPQVRRDQRKVTQAG